MMAGMNMAKEAIVYLKQIAMELKGIRKALEEQNNKEEKKDDN